MKYLLELPMLGEMYCLLMVILPNHCLRRNNIGSLQEYMLLSMLLIDTYI